MNSIATQSDQTLNARAMNAPTTWGMLVLLAAALLLFLPFVGRRDVVTSHEARVVQTARQMAAVGWAWDAKTVDVPPPELTTIDGAVRLAWKANAPPIAVNPWMVPVLDGHIRLEKPPLPYWCAAAMFRLVDFGEGMARLPGAILGALATIFIFDLARRLLGDLGGWCAAGIWLSSHFVFDEYRKSMADPYLAFFTLVCVWAWVVAYGRGAGASPESIEIETDTRASSRGAWLMLVFYVSLALGVLAKGPVILPHVLVAIVAFHLCYGWKKQPKWWTHVLGVIVFVLIAAPWFLYVLRHVPNAMAMWRYESVGEFGENTENARPWWFYPPNLLLIAMPWTPMLLVAPFAGGVRRNRRMLFPLIWYVAIVVFFSLAHLKKNAYLLPMMPAQTLIIAQGCVALIDAARRTKFRDGPGALAFIQACIGIGFAVAMLVLIPRLVTHPAPYIFAAAIALVGVSLAMVVVFTRMPLPWMRNQVIGYALVIFVFVNFYVAPRENHRSPKLACRAAMELLRGDASATMLLTGLPAEASLYLPLGIRQDPRASHVVAVMDTRLGDVTPDPAAFEPLLSRKVSSVEQLPVNGALKGRWKLFRMNVE